MDSILGPSSQNPGFSVDGQSLRPPSPLEHPLHETALQPEFVDGFTPMDGAIAPFPDLDGLTAPYGDMVPVALQFPNGDELTGTEHQVGDAAAQSFALATVQNTTSDTTSVTTTSVTTTSINRTQVNQVVAALSTVGTTLDTTGAFAGTMPLPATSDVDTPISLGTLIDPETVLKTLQTQLASALPENATVDNLVEFFSNRWNGAIVGDDEQLLNTKLGQIQITSRTVGVTPRRGANNAEITEVQVEFTARRTSSFSISEAPELQDQLIDIDGQLNTALNSRLTINATFILGSDVSLRVNEFAARVDVTAPTLPDAEVNVGVLGMDGTDGTIDLSSNVQVNFAPTKNLDGLTTSELNTPINTLLTLNATSQFDLNLQLTPEAGITPSQPLTGTLNLGGGMDFLANPSVLPVTLPAHLRDFTRVNPNELLQPMLLFASWLDNLDGSSLYAQPLPFIEGLTMGQAIDLGGALRSEVTDWLQVPANQPFAGLANFTTIQDMVARITQDDSLTAHYDSATDELTFRVVVQDDQRLLNSPDGPKAFTRPLDLTVDTGALHSIRDAADVTIAPTVDLAFTYGIDLTAQAQTTLAPALQGDRLLPQSGQLSGNAAFLVDFGNNSVVQVRVLQSATSTNQSPADLLADVQAALTAAGLERRLQVDLIEPDSPSLKFTSLSGEAFTIRVDDSTDVAVRQLGLRSPTVQLQAIAGIDLNPPDATPFTLTAGNETRSITVAPPSRTSFMDNLNAALQDAFGTANESPRVVARLESDAQGAIRLTFFSDRDMTIDLSDEMALRLGFEPVTSTNPTPRRTSIPDLATQFTAAADLNTVPAGTLNEPLSFVLEVSHANQITGGAIATPSLVEVSVTVPQTRFGNLGELVGNINTALRQQLTASGFAADLVQAVAVDNRVQFQMQATAVDPFLRLKTLDNDNPILTQLGFSNGQFAQGALMDVNDPNAPIPVFFNTQESTMTGTVALSLNDSDASARVGVVNLDVTTLTVAGTGSLTTSLKSLDGSDRIRYEQLDAARVVTIAAQQPLVPPGNIPDGRLSDGASLSLKLNNEAPVTVTIPRTESITAGRAVNEQQLFSPIQFQLTVNGTTAGLFITAQQLQDARAQGGLTPAKVRQLVQQELTEVGLGDRVAVALLDNRLRFSAINPSDRLKISGAEELGFEADQEHSIDELLIDANLALGAANLGDRVVIGYAEQTHSLVIGATLDQTITVVGYGGAGSSLGFAPGQTAASVVNTPMASSPASAPLTLTLDGQIAGSDEPVTLTVTVPDFTNPTAAQVTFTSESETLLTSLTLTQVLDLLKGAGTVLEESLQSDELAQPVALLNQTVRSLNNYSATFAQVLRELEQEAGFAQGGVEPTGETLQSLERRLQQKLGLTQPIFTIADNRLSLDLTFVEAAVKRVPFAIPLLDIAKDAFGADNIPVGIDLAGAGLPTIDAVITSTDGTEQVDVTTTVNADLRLGLDFNGTAPVYQVGEDTQVEVSVQASESLNFNAQYDLATFDITDGSLDINAIYRATLEQVEDLTVFDAVDLNTDVTGMAEVGMDIRYEERLSDDAVVDRPGTINITYADLSTGVVSLNEDLPNLVDVIQGQERQPDGRLGGAITNRFVSGVNQVLNRIEDGLLNAIRGVEIPMVGDQLQAAMEPFFETLRTIRADIQDQFERLAEKDLVEAVGDLLFEVFGPSGLGILRNSTTTNQAAIDRNDILTLRSDRLLDENNNPIFGIGEQFVEWNFHLGQEFTFTTPNFDLGLRTGDFQLEDLLPNFGFNLKSDDGITFSIRWDLRLGFGVSEEEGFYMNSGATTELTHSAEVLPTSADSVDELSVNITIEAGDPYAARSGLSANVALGLLQGNLSDGTSRKTQLTIEDAVAGLTGSSPLATLKHYQVEFDLNLTYLKPAPKDSQNPPTLEVLRLDNISYTSSAPEAFTEFLLKLNLAVYNKITEVARGQGTIFTDSPFPALAIVPDLSQLLNGTMPLLLQARFPEIVGMELKDFVLKENADFTIGRPSFTEVSAISRQFEDGRSRTLGFGFNQFSAEGRLVATDLAPVNGKVNEDVDLRLIIGGDRVNGETVNGTAIDLNLVSGLSGEIDTLQELVDALNTTLQTRLDQGFAANQRPTIRVVADNGRISFVGDRPLTLLFQAEERSKVEINLGLNLVDSDFPEDASEVNGAIEQGLREGNQSFFNRVSVGDLFNGNLTDVLKPTLEATGQLRLRVDADSRHITNFVEQKLSIFNSIKKDGTKEENVSLQLPSVSFDLKIDASVSLGIGTDGSPEPEYEIGEFHFDNIALDVGNLLDNLVKPIANTVGRVLDPILKVVGTGTDKVDSFLTRPLPLLDRIGINTSLRDIGSSLPGFQNLIKLYDLTKQLVGVAQGISGFLGSYSGAPIRFGCLELDMDPKSPFYFPKIQTPIPCEVGTAVDQIRDIDISKLFGNGLSAGGTLEPGGLKLDILTPGAVVDLLLGQPLDLLSLNLPKVDLFLGADFGFRFKQLGFNIHAGATIKADLGIGYDSTGLERLIDTIQAGGVPDFSDLLDGFYIRDNPGSEMSLGLSIGGGGHVGPIRSPRIDLGLIKIPAVTIFEASAQASVSGGISFDLVDPNNDGRIRLDEIMALTNNFQEPENLIQMFNVQGHLKGGFEASITAFNKRLSTRDLPFPTDFNLNFSTNDILRGVVTPPTKLTPELATIITVEGERVLRINTGPYANARIAGDTDDSDNTVQVKGSRNKDNTISIELTLNGERFTRNYAGDVSRILVVGSKEGDRFDFSGLNLTTTRS